MQTVTVRRALAIILVGVLCLSDVPVARAADVAVNVNFQSETAAVPSGYSRDYGQAYDATRGYGWIAQSSTTPKSIVGRGRERGAVSDQRLDTLMHMQENWSGSTSTVDPARWEHVLTNGDYDVTVAVGDPTTTNSVHRIVAENTVIVNNFVPSTTVKHTTKTVRVTVSDGKLTLNTAGGTNTKINYIQIKSAVAVVNTNVNFQSETATVPSGYSRDYGQAYDATRGYGWIAQSSTTPTPIIGRGRERNIQSDQRLDTLIHMQNNGSVVDPARWEYALSNGEYDVTVAVGDPSATDSRHRIMAEDVVMISGFIPGPTTKFATTTARVIVRDGRLTLDATGGLNTKLNYIQIKSANTVHKVTSVDPLNGATNVPVTTSVTLGLSHPIDNSQAVLKSLELVAPNGSVLPGTYNGDAAGSLITFTPSSILTISTKYTIRTTSALIDGEGNAFQAFTSSFTTSSQGVPPSGIHFTRSTVDASMPNASVVTLGPDGNLYAASASGQIKKYQLDSNGVPTGTVTNITAFANQRVVLGLAFDPRSTATNPILWVSHGAMGFSDMPNFTGSISVLTGSNLTTKREVITGLPRAVRDHMNNGIAFGPDGKLYIAQGSLSGYGAPDGSWGNRAETPLSASILVADVVNDTRFSGIVSVNTSAGYNAGASTAPVKTYAVGLRNPYDLVWHSNGSLYVPVNESAGGNAPAGPSGTPSALNYLPAGRDFLARVQAGKYYGHPNPSIGNYTLNGGNPSNGVDPFEVSQYPVGTQPASNWQKPILDLGLHRSANGITEFRSNAFSGQLQGRLLIAEFSGGDDILAVKLNSDGTAASSTPIQTGFYNPLDVTARSNGNLYVAEYGDDTTGAGGKITLLRPQ